ncbi:MAG: isoprenylcysteine carboxylmethyltransferase family protein [Anaerolineae bacterium]|jgi:protein-S-isoprenylcysteine O-methyltransferase Ste14|nr:isoprenylcysteine carboxylmethyltransferase family protein [Anaerolineae bacterium]
MESKPKAFPIAKWIQVFLYLLFFPLLPLILSGRWDWWEAWVYALICIAGFVVSRLLVARKNPDLIAERGKFLKNENTQPWDKILAPLVGLGGNLIPLVVGLEAYYGQVHIFSWIPKIVSLILFLAGFAWSSWALVENRFFSGTVRVQSERGHQVVSSGPYHFMRHPGYAGALLAYLTVPVFLDSVWTLIPAGLLTVLIFIRTRLEDDFLQDQLPGYKEYAQKVHYRLLPGIW